MNAIVEIKVLDNFQIWIKFNDGVEKVVNIRQFLGKGITKELLDIYDSNLKCKSILRLNYITIKYLFINWFPIDFNL